MDWQVPLFKIYWDESDVTGVTDIIKSGSFWADGAIIQEFEKKIAEYNRVKHCVVFNNGTSALHAVFLAYGISKGDEVIVPSFTFISTANSVLFVDAKPVLVDIEPRRLGLDPSSVEKAINSTTKAIMPVHYAGAPSEIQKLKDIADEKDLILIEDNAEALGAKFSNKLLGTFGDATLLSFCQNKIITTGEGGAIITNNEELYEKLKLIRSHGRALNDSNYFTSSKSPDYVSLGYNLRMPSMNAMLGVTQLEKIEKIINLRQGVANRYKEAFKEIEEITFQYTDQNDRHVHQLASIILKDNSAREGLRNHLSRRGIMSKVYFDPIHKSHYYQNVLKYDNHLKITEDVSSRVLSLPMYPNLDTETQLKVIDETKDYFR